MIRLKLAPPLTHLVGVREISVEVNQASLTSVLELALTTNPKFRSAMLDQTGNLSLEYSCLVNNRRYNVTELSGVEVREGDEIVILLPLAGGL